MKSLGTVTLCALSQHAKGQTCFEHRMLVSGPAGPGRLALCAGPAAIAAAVRHFRVSRSPPLSRLGEKYQEGLSAADFLQGPASPMPLPSFQGAFAHQRYLLVLGVGTETCPMGHLPPNAPCCPAVDFGFCSVYFKKIHWLASVFGWLVGWFAINTYQPLTSWSICFLRRYSSE